MTHKEVIADYLIWNTRKINILDTDIYYMTRDEMNRVCRSIGEYVDFQQKAIIKEMKEHN